MTELTIIIPTWNNPQFLNPCVDSIKKTGVLERGFAKLIIVNNGKQPCEEQFKGEPGIQVVTARENLGWEGGLKEGMKYCDTPFVCFQNDDTHIPSIAQLDFYEKLCASFTDESIGIVAPVTTVASGMQSIYSEACPTRETFVNWLIFCCVVVRVSALEEAGGIDYELPGGDDFDLSIRMRARNKKLLINPSAFIIHHGFKSGTRLKGESNVPGGWNSMDMIERTNHALIRKHGFKNWFNNTMIQDSRFQLSLP